MAMKTSMDEKFLKKLIDIIDINLENEQFGVSELASEIGLSRSQLHRKLQDINGKSTSQFIREYRLQRAMEMLKGNQFTASEISYRVGFSSPSYFNKCFHNLYGYPPGKAVFNVPVASSKKNFSKKMMGIIPLIVLIGLIVFNELGKASVDSINLEKTIAVMPFVNDSPNNENIYLCNGIMAGIRDHLAKVPDFIVVSRRSVEKYRNNPTSLNVIAKELDVNYLVEGRVQRIGDRAIISAELISVKDNKVVWSESYKKDVSEIFEVQVNVIESITNNLETIISPNLKNVLNTTATQDKLAVEYFLQGEEYRYKANRPLQKHEVWLDLINNAKSSYEQAIKRDSLFASAYFGLALTAFERYGYYVDDENNLDEILHQTNKVLQLDPNHSSAYRVRGNYFESINQKDKAIMDYEKSLKIFPNNVSALNSLIKVYKTNNNYKDAMITLEKLEEFSKSRDELNILYSNYIMFYRILEQHDMVDYYYNKIFEAQTTSGFNVGRFWSYIHSTRFEKARVYTEETILKNNQLRNGLLGYIYLREKDFPKALEYYRKCYEQVEVEGINSLASRFVYSGYGEVLIRTGQIEKGTKMLKKQPSINNNMLNSKRSIDKPIMYLSSASLYAYLGEYDQVHDIIEKFDTENGWLYWDWMIFEVKKDDFFDLLRNDPVFNASYKRGEKQVEEIQKQVRLYLPSTLPN